MAEVKSVVISAVTLNTLVFLSPFRGQSCWGQNKHASKAGSLHLMVASLNFVLSLPVQVFF